MERATRVFHSCLKDEAAQRRAFDRLLADLPGHGFAQADVGDRGHHRGRKAKRDLFSAIEPRIRPARYRPDRGWRSLAES